MIELQLIMFRRSRGSGTFLLFHPAFRQGTLVCIFDASCSVQKAVVFQRIKMILTSLKDSDNLSGARFTPASVRRALKGKILFVCRVRNPQIEFRMVANLRPDLTWSDLTWLGRFTAILSSYQKFLGLSQYTSDPILTGSKGWFTTEKGRKESHERTIEVWTNHSVCSRRG